MEIKNHNIFQSHILIYISGGAEKNHGKPQTSHISALPLTFKKSTAIPLLAWTGSEGSRRLRLPDFKTFDT
jgi:hypothetical protein